MDVILLIFACFWISRRARENGLNATNWVLGLIGVYILFEITGVLISFSITGGNLLMAGLFGFVCAVGGFLLIKYRMDKAIARERSNDESRSD